MVLYIGTIIGIYIGEHGVGISRKERTTTKREAESYRGGEIDRRKENGKRSGNRRGVGLA